MLIDCHAHLLPRDYPADAPECFPRMEPIDGETARLLVFGAMKFKARDVFFEAERRVEAMDAAGVDAEVLTPMPPLLRYELPAGDYLSLCRWVNEFTAELCASQPGRMYGFGIVPMQDVDAATAELKAIREAGLYGVEISSNIAGASIGDERFLPFFQEAERLGIPIFVHAMPSPNPRLPMSTMGTFVVGIEGMYAAASLIHGGTAEKCPNLRISFSHAAGGFPLMLPRAQYFWGGTWNEEPPMPEKAVAHTEGPSPMEYARRFYYDSLVFDRRALRFLVDLLGHDRLLVGSDFPAMDREDPCGRTLRMLDLPQDVLDDITWNNAFRWLGIDPPR